MNISWIKLEGDNKTFKIPELLGMDVFSIKEEKRIDDKIDELTKKNYNTIIISKKLANFSQKINLDYAKNQKIKVIISIK